MKAVQLIAPGRPLEMREIPVPEPGPADVLVRVKAAGICHSDAHYRAGKSRVEPLPMTLGHEVSGVVERTGADAAQFQPGDRVCLHYLATCGHCGYCDAGTEQFCDAGVMMGKFRPGGYAQYVVMPARSVFALPAEVSFEHGAVMMCSSATSLHALNKARLQPGESVAVFGLGGLGASAAQLARAMGAREVYGVDIKPAKLELARRWGVVPINAATTDPVAEIMKLTGGRGVDVALELIGLPLTMQQSVRVLGNLGRAALVGITEKSFEIAPYGEVLNKESEIIGVSDHLAREIPALIDYVRRGQLDLTPVISRTVPLEAGAINEVLDSLNSFGDAVRVVIVP